jgi:hypothetical protein
MQFDVLLGRSAEDLFFAIRFRSSFLISLRADWSGVGILHKVGMQFEVVLSSANQDLVSSYLDPRSLDLEALQNILAIAVLED